MIVINSTVDAIYDNELNRLYFKKLSTISSIFKGIDVLYREATQADTEEFLDNNFINLTNDYNATKVKTANRKRIAMVFDTLGSLTPKNKVSLLKYIKDYCIDLNYNTAAKAYDIGSEKELKMLLYGIEQRFYTTPIGKEKRIASSIIKLTAPTQPA